MDVSNVVFSNLSLQLKVTSLDLNFCDNRSRWMCQALEKLPATCFVSFKNDCSIRDEKSLWVAGSTRGVLVANGWVTLDLEVFVTKVPTLLD